MKVQQVLVDAWYFYTANIRYILYLCIPFVFVEALLAEGLIAAATPEGTEQQGGIFGSMAIVLGIYPLYTAILILYLQARSKGELIDRRRIIGKALSLWPTMVVLVVMEFVLFLLGFMLFVLPGIWVAVRMAFAEFRLVEHDEQPVEALRKSFALTERDFWLVFAVMLIPEALIVLAKLAMPGVIEMFGNLFILHVLWHMAAVMLQMFPTIALYRLYMQIDKPGSAISGPDSGSE